MQSICHVKLLNPLSKRSVVKTKIFGLEFELAVGKRDSAQVIRPSPGISLVQIQFAAEGPLNHIELDLSFEICAIL